MKSLVSGLLTASLLAMPLMAMAGSIDATNGMNSAVNSSSSTSDNNAQTTGDTKASHSFLWFGRNKNLGRQNTSLKSDPALDIVDATSQAGDFHTLTTALQAAGLTDTLKGKGPFTIFAPTDAAFAALPQGTLDELLKPENREKLTQVLTYHVVPGRVTSSQVATMKEVKTVEGADVAISKEQGSVMINNANLVQKDIKTKNGIIHVIDKVLIPES